MVESTKKRMIALEPDKFAIVANYLEKLVVPMNKPALLSALEVVNALETAVDINLVIPIKTEEVPKEST